MSLQIIFLGTAGSVPTPSRSLPAIAVRRKGELLLFDCGEGVQRQMIRAALGFRKKMKIFITHMHGDHVLGLPGLIQTMSLLDRTTRLEIFGPSGLEDFVASIQKSVLFSTTFPLEMKTLENPGLVLEEREYKIFAASARHYVPAFAYSLVEERRPGRFYPKKARALGIPEGPIWTKLQHGLSIELPNGRIVEPNEVVGPARPGRKLVYTGDSSFSKSIVKLAENADVLIHDCTFDDKLAGRALRDGHSTPSDAARTARAARVERLILTHLSARYKTTDLLLGQAKKDFQNVSVAEDFMRVDLPLQDSE